MTEKDLRMNRYPLRPWNKIWRRGHMHIPDDETRWLLPFVLKKNRLSHELVLHVLALTWLANQYDSEGKYHGMHISLYSNGEIFTREMWNHGLSHGLNEHWSRSGRLTSRYFKEAGKFHGLNKIWHPNGKPRYKIMYEDGKRHGSFESWFQSGQRKKIAMYCRGELIHGSCERWTSRGETIPPSCRRRDFRPYDPPEYRRWP